MAFTASKIAMWTIAIARLTGPVRSAPRYGWVWLRPLASIATWFQYLTQLAASAGGAGGASLPPPPPPPQAEARKRRQRIASLRRDG